MLSDSQLSGVLTSSSGGMTNLQWLNLSDNKPLGLLPSSLGNLTNLTQNGDDYFDAYPTWSPDGATIAYYSGSDRVRDRAEGIYLMEANGENVKRLTSTGQIFNLF